MQSIDTRLTSDLIPLLDVRGAVESRRSSLGTSTSKVRAANNLLLRKIADHEGMTKQGLGALSKVLGL